MKNLFSIIFLIFATQSYASHIVGGELFYDCLGGNQYQVTLKIYRDCNSTGAQYDPNLPVTVFDGNDNQLTTFTIAFPGSVTLPVNFNNNPCITVPSNICIEEAIYQKTVTLPPSTTGYTLAYQRCCRGPNVTNLLVPDDQGLTLIGEIPPSNFITCNSSPRFTNIPPLLLCNNATLQFDHSATDPDGDSLVYSLCTPYQGGSSFDPAPNPAAPPPYNLVNWGATYSAINPFGNGTISINPNTGWLQATPQSVGLYAVGICVSEYRNGVFISTTRRDFLFRVLDCQIDLIADIRPQEDLPTFVSFCQGSTITFKNDSFGATSYQWDFGVPGGTSTAFEPTFTFPGPGTYTVTLVASLGQGCSDTATQVFIIEDEVKAEFVPPDPQCIVDNSYDFTGGGIIPAGSTVFWDFGTFATPSTSTSLNPTNVVFSQSGYHEVSFSVFHDDCDDTYIEDVLVYAEPTIGFRAIDEVGCAPFHVQFANQSFAHTPFYSEWKFGDGAVGFNLNPTHTYQDSGLYTVELMIYTDAGCIDTLYMTKTDYIEVFPSPTSAFTVDPLEQDEYSAEFTFTNLSDDFVKQWFHFGNGAVTPFEEFTYTYPEPGIYYPYQIVKNQYGCRDTSMTKITINPVIPIMVPNAFTPDGNAYNNTFKPILYKPQNYKMWIYNRWGELMFLSEHPEAEWDGNYGGGPAPTGVYVWKIIYYEYDTGLPKQIMGM